MPAARVPLTFHLTKVSPAERAIWERYRHLVEEAGPSEMVVTKSRIAFRAVSDANILVPADFGADEPVVVTRFGLAEGDHKPVFVDLLYPVSALKPHTAVKVADVGKRIDGKSTTRRGIKHADLLTAIAERDRKRATD